MVVGDVYYLLVAVFNEVAGKVQKLLSEKRGFALKQKKTATWAVFTFI